MGSPFLDAFIAYWRKKVKTDADKAAPAVGAADRTRRGDFGPAIPKLLGYIFAGGIVSEEQIGALALNPAVDWEAFLVFSDGDGSAEAIDNLLFNPTLDRLASGRVVVVFIIEDAAEGFISKICATHSDDGGATWSAKVELSIDVSPFLNPAFAGGMTLVEAGGNIHAYLRGLTSNTDKIYRMTYNGTSWTSQVVFYDGAGVLSRFRAARRRDRTAAGMLVTENIVGGYKVIFIPIDSSGNAGTVQTVDAGPIVSSGNDSLALRYDEDGNPVALARFEDATAETGTGSRKIYAGGWPGSWTTFTIDNPPTDPDAFMLIVFGFSELLWGGSVRASQGDTHALKEAPGAHTYVPDYRKRIAGVWSQAEVDFATLAFPISGTGTAKVASHNLAKLIDSGKATGVVWTTAAADGHPFKLWFIRRTAENA